MISGKLSWSLLSGAVCAVCPAIAETLPGLYTNSWLFNTYGRPADHIAHNIDYLSITPSVKVATLTSFDESGPNVVFYNSTGAKIGIPVGSGTGREGRIFAHKKSDGSKAGEIVPFSSTGSYSGRADINGAICATKRSNGEFLIFVEDDALARLIIIAGGQTHRRDKGWGCLMEYSITVLRLRKSNALKRRTRKIWQPRVENKLQMYEKCKK